MTDPAERERQLAAARAQLTGAPEPRQPITFVEDLYEPYLIQIGFLQRTPRGRVASKLAYEHLGYPWQPKPGEEATMFE